MWNLDSLFFLKASSSFFFLIKKSWAKKIKADIGKPKNRIFGLKKNKSQHQNKSQLL